MPQHRLTRQGVSLLECPGKLQHRSPGSGMEGNQRRTGPQKNPLAAAGSAVRGFVIPVQSQSIAIGAIVFDSYPGADLQIADAFLRDGLISAVIHPHADLIHLPCLCITLLDLVA